MYIITQHQLKQPLEQQELHHHHPNSMNFSSEAFSELLRDTLSGTLFGNSQAATNDSTQNVTDIVLHHSSTDNKCNDIVLYQPEVQSLLDELQRVKQNKITDGTRDSYCSANVNFIIFLYKHFPQIFHESFLHNYHELRETAASPRAYSKAIAESLGANNICPFDATKFKPEMFTSYLVSLKRDSGGYYSVSYYENKKSAFQHLMEESGNPLHPDVIKEFNLVMGSLKKTISAYNQKHGISCVEGKEHMSFECYKLTCQLLVEDGSAESIAALTFLTLQWNLIARSETVGLIFLTS